MPPWVLLVLLAVFAASFAGFWLSRLARSRSAEPRWPTLGKLAIGLGTNFFDTLGIGNFAPTTALYRVTKMVPDRLIPGTMNVGHTLPVVLMAFLFIDTVRVETTTLVTMIAAAILGAWVGAGIVSRLPRRKIQVGMGLGLLVAAGFLMHGQFQPDPPDQGSLGLSVGTLIFAAVAIGLLGGLMTIGVGLYAPCMVLVSLLGMNPKAAFPIMMGACAFLMPVASARFVRTESLSPSAALGLTLGGIPGVLLAFFLVQKLPLYGLKWLVVGVVVVTAAMMLGDRSREPLPASTDRLD